MHSSPHSYEGRDLEAMAVLSRYYDWIMETFNPFLQGQGIEYGAGQGTISERLAPHVETLELVEPSANLFDILSAKFMDEPNVAIHQETMEEHLQNAPAGSKDVVVMVNVLEHIEDDDLALAGLFKILKPGGRLLLFVPAMSWLFSDFDRLVGHFRRYHKGALTSKVKTAGFDLITARYCDLLGVLPWLILNRLMRKTKLNPGLVQMYDRVGTPTTRAIEKLFAPPLGKNIILVARKPAGD